MSYDVDDIVEYQFESMILPRIGRVMEVSDNGLYVLDQRDTIYLPFALTYIRAIYVEHRKEVYSTFYAHAKSKLEEFKSKLSTKMLSMGDSRILEEGPCVRSTRQEKKLSPLKPTLSRRTRYTAR